jgi:predicted methyltransferase
MIRILFFGVLFLLAACSKAPEETLPATDKAAAEASIPQSADSNSGSSLADVLAAQPDDVRARYRYRHPAETLEFFGIKPGMTVVEGLPGGGWYTRILAPYLGPKGRLIGANYSLELYPLFDWVTDEFMEGQRAWQASYPGEITGVPGAPQADAFYFGSMPSELAATADVVFLPRVLHNAARFQDEGKGDFLAAILADSLAVLKPGGVLGVVQHEADEDMSDAFANGGHGYLKKDWLIAEIEKAGFEFVDSSDINANSLDRPTEDEVVWRLPPSYADSRDDPEKKAAVDAIGESNRMTLKFIKPR